MLTILPLYFVAAAAILTSFLTCFLLLAGLLRTGWAWRIATDTPNARSLHEHATPRVGGWGIVPAILLGLGFVGAIRGISLIWLPIAGGLFTLAVLSQIDDRRGLAARVRFPIHVVVVVALIASFPSAMPWWQLAGLGFAMTWLINLYNFMDGADGLAGGMALFGFGGYAIAAIGYDFEVTVVAGIVAAAAAAFLIFNFNPARIFLGDAGSIPLGYLAGAVGYVGWRSGIWPLWFPIMIFGPFIYDATVTLMRRLMRGERFWHAHREHFYQRMIRMGDGHAGTAKAWYIVMSAGVALAIINIRLSAESQWILPIAWLCLLTFLGCRVDARWQAFNKKEADVCCG